MGLSTAFHLLNTPTQGSTPLRICIVERDCSYAQASATLSAGGIRQQFSLPLNIAMTMYGIDFLSSIPSLLQTHAEDAEVPDIQLRENGYLFLASTPEGHRTLRDNVAAQQHAGCTWIKALTQEELAARFPWCKTDDILSATLGTRREGWFDPWSYISALRRKLKSQGVDFVQGTISGVAVDPASKAITRMQLQGSAVSHVSGKHFVNAMGPFAASLIGMAEAAAGVRFAELPVRPRKRVIYAFHCTAPSAPPSSTPLVVDPSGVYFRPEGTNSNRFICGVSPPVRESLPLCQARVQRKGRGGGGTHSLYTRTHSLSHTHPHSHTLAHLQTPRSTKIQTARATMRSHRWMTPCLKRLFGLRCMRASRVRLIRSR
jgi:FAD-dependent oxidoreductase domain-containing protein 1